MKDGTHPIWEWDPGHARTPEVLEQVHLPCPHGAPEPRVPVLVASVHDGTEIPAGAEDFARELPPDALADAFARERDWGADAVACALGLALGLRSVHRVTRARAFVDCGRGPGGCEPGATGLDTRAVPWALAGTPFPPDVDAALHAEHEAFLAAFDRLLAPAPSLLVTVHTYDPVGPDGPRAPIGLVYRDRHDEVATAARGLVDHLERGFEAAGLRLAHNDPYRLAPDGPELRAHERLGPDASVLVIEFRKDLVLGGETTSEGWFRPHREAWKRDAIAVLGRVAARAVGAFLLGLDPGERAA